MAIPELGRLSFIGRNLISPPEMFISRLELCARFGFIIKRSGNGVVGRGAGSFEGAKPHKL